MLATDNPAILLRALAPWCLSISCFALGCGRDTPASPPASQAAAVEQPKPNPASTKKKPRRPVAKSQPAPPFEPQPTDPTAAADPLPEKTLEELVKPAAAEEFELPQFDDAKIAA